MGVHAAGCALDDAGLNTAIQSKQVDMNLATNGGGREIDADEAILREISSVGSDLNALMMRKMRPSYFLSQLPNMLAGNIAVVHGVGGASRTFMGEEEAGVAALSTAVKRIAHGQSDIILVGGVQDAECVDRLIGMVIGGIAQSGPASRVANADRNGLLPGSLASFLVLESVAHARARNASIHAIISGLATDWSASEGECLQASYSKLIQRLSESCSAPRILSAACGLPARTRAEFDALAGLELPVSDITSTDILGHGMEAHFLGLITTAICKFRHGDASNMIAAMVGHRAGIAAALLGPAE